MMIGAGPKKLPVRRLATGCRALRGPSELLLLELRRAMRPDDLRRAHVAVPAVAGMPDTFVADRRYRLDDCLLGRRPALEDADVATEAQHGDPVRGCSKTSCRLCEIGSTPSPCSPRRRTSASTCSVWATPRALSARRGSRAFEFHIHRARDCDRLALAAGERCDRLTNRLDRGDLERRVRVLLHRRLVEDLEPLRLTAEVHVLHDIVEVVAQRQILVENPPSLAASFGGADLAPLCPGTEPGHCRRSASRRCT